MTESEEKGELEAFRAVATTGFGLWEAAQVPLKSL